ncbi:hypothetical protein [Thermococcus sp.]|uniref:hypothetical protein n=1 Tax=Thermococcus sp. TaxID=35749 RepID=UPI00262984AC|nr:hypothetical protein [Thermococcus sp.]
MGTMAEKMKVIYYLFELRNQPMSAYAREMERHLKHFVRLVNPDEYSLFENSRGILRSSGKVYIIELRDELSRWFYIAPVVENIEKPEAAYEYEIGKEKGLEAVLREIAEGKAHRKWSVNKISTVLQIILWGGFFVLSYFGYKNDQAGWVSNLLPLVFLLSGLIEGFRRGYKKKKR